MTLMPLAKPFRLLLLVALFATLFLTVAPAHAASFNVTTTLDGADSNPGDGLCRSIGNRCTLRAAIQEANALSGTDTINVPAGTYLLTRSGSDDTTLNGDLDINSNLIILGANQATTIIDGNSLDRVFHITGLFKVAFADLTIQGGNQAGTGLGGGGIANSNGKLTLTRVTIRNNTAFEAGGGLFTNGVATLNQVHIANNSGSTGGGLSNGGKLTLTHSTIDGNTAGAGGGGISNSPDATLTVSFTTISNNSTDDGGGLTNVGGFVTIDSSAIISNTAPLGAGGINSFLGGTLHLVNSTVSGNSATIAAGIAVGSGTATLASVTITNNSANHSAGLVNTGGVVKLKNTILADNPGGGDCAGSLDSFGYNLIGNASCSITGDTTGNLTGVSAQLSPLAFSCGFGVGPTLGHCPAFTSPAVDAANPDGCTDFNNALLNFDQKGPGSFNSRHYLMWGPARCDIGSFEINIDL